MDSFTEREEDVDVSKKVNERKRETENVVSGSQFRRKFRRGHSNTLFGLSRQSRLVSERMGVFWVFFFFLTQRDTVAETDVHRLITSCPIIILSFSWSPLVT